MNAGLTLLLYTTLTPWGKNVQVSCKTISSTGCPLYTTRYSDDAECWWCSHNTLCCYGNHSMAGGWISGYMCLPWWYWQRICELTQKSADKQPWYIYDILGEFFIATKVTPRKQDVQSVACVIIQTLYAPWKRNEGNYAAQPSFQNGSILGAWC